jgi:deaminated glutathione amidase
LHGGSIDQCHPAVSGEEDTLQDRKKRWRFWRDPVASARAVRFAAATHKQESGPMRVSVVQMNPGADKAENIAQARRLIEEAVDADRPDIVSLPEVWDSLGGDRAVRNANAELLPARGSNEPGGQAYEFLREAARATKTHVHGGSIIEKGPEKLFNTTVVFNPDGTEIARYRKMHLFDIVAPDGTGYRESNTYGAGDEVVTYEADGTKVGCAICYDVRFPDLFWKLREEGADLIFLPSAFTLATGKDHWETLIRGRAIETQCWFAAPATWGKHLEGKGEPRFTYGHSLVADPWGHVVAKVSDGTGWATARIDPKVTARVRRDMPVLEHRKRV